MALRPLFTNVLTNLKFAQLLNHERPDHQSDQQRSQARKHRTKRKVAKDAKYAKVRKQLLVQQPIEQRTRLITRGSSIFCTRVKAILTAVQPVISRFFNPEQPTPTT